MRFLLVMLLTAVCCTVQVQAQTANGEGSNAEQPTQGKPDSTEVGDPGESGQLESTTKEQETTRGQGDFKPREQISEDYPVPLPADI